MKRSIFPDYEEGIATMGGSWVTYVRKKHKGVYYLIPVTRKVRTSDPNQIDIARKEFISECYKVAMFYKVRRWQLDEKVIGIDKYQESEEDRLLNKAK